MDKYERRRINLAHIRDTACDGMAASLAVRIGRDPSYVSRMLYPEGKAGKKRIGDDMVDIICEAFSLPRGWLDDDHGSDTTIKINNPSNAIKQQVQEGDVLISQYDTGGAMGYGVVLPDQPGIIQSWMVSRDWVEKNVRNHTGAHNLKVVTGFGDSMLGMFNPGDPLLIDSGIKTANVDGVYFFRVGNEGFIKRLQRIPGQGILVLSDNPAYRDWTITPDMDFEVFGRVITAWKSTEY